MQEPQGDVTMKAEVGIICFGDEGSSFNMPGFLGFLRDRSLATSEKEGFGGNHHMKR